MNNEHSPFSVPEPPMATAMSSETRSTSTRPHTAIWLVLTAVIWIIFVIPPLNAILTGTGDVAYNAGKLTGAVVWPVFWMALVMFASRLFRHKWPTHIARWLFVFTVLSLYACPFRK